MQGNEVFKVAVKTLGAIAQEALDKAGVTKEELEWLVPHQAYIRIIQAMAIRLNNGKSDSHCSGPRQHVCGVGADGA